MAHSLCFHRSQGRATPHLRLRQSVYVGGGRWVLGGGWVCGGGVGVGGGVGCGGQGGGGWVWGEGEVNSHAYIDRCVVGVCGWLAFVCSAACVSLFLSC